VFLVLALLAGCSGDDKDDQGPALPHPDGAVEVTVSAAVVDDGGGARLCLGRYDEDEEFPTCTDIRVEGVRWPEKERKGFFDLRGTYDGRTFRAREAVPVARVAGLLTIDETPPCPEPADGWPVPRPDRATGEDFIAATGVIEGLPDLSGYWYGPENQARIPSHIPLPPEPAAFETSLYRTLMVVWVADDVARATRVIRAVWGGPLCVASARHHDDELAATVRRVQELPGHLLASNFRDHVQVVVLYDDGTMQEQMDQELEPGLVTVISAIRAT
jgi:hypothetical protein